jgi:hypothetical protein
VIEVLYDFSGDYFFQQVIETLLISMFSGLDG